MVWYLIPLDCLDIYHSSQLEICRTLSNITDIFSSAVSGEIDKVMSKVRRCRLRAKTLTKLPLGISLETETSNLDTLLTIKRENYSTVSISKYPTVPL